MRNMLNGIPVVTLDYMFEEVTDKPKRYHRKKRIQKKYLKKYGYGKKASKQIMMVGGILYCHSKTLRQIKNRDDIENMMVSKIC